MKFLAGIVAVLTSLLLLNSALQGERITTRPKNLPEYATVRQQIEDMRQRYAAAYSADRTETGRAGIIQQAKTALYRVICADLAPQWFGTPWDYHGTTQTPQAGKIACGYLVSTILRDAGFAVQRIELAQQPSEIIIKSLTGEGHIQRFRDAPIDVFVDAIEEWGPGFYLVGLDIHTGFIVNDAGEVSFIHSSFLEPAVVLKEDARKSPILQSSRYRVLGKLSQDDELVVKWLLGSEIPTRDDLLH